MLATGVNISSLKQSKPASSEMLRRPPTAIRLTTEDILAYDDRNIRRAGQDENVRASNVGKEVGPSNLESTNNNTTTPSRDERIGIVKQRRP
jgi:hypothetical protein